jgi:hypothetical protein
MKQVKEITPLAKMLEKLSFKDMRAFLQEFEVTRRVERLESNHFRAEILVVTKGAATSYEGRHTFIPEYALAHALEAFLHGEKLDYHEYQIREAGKRDG